MLISYLDEHEDAKETARWVDSPHDAGCGDREHHLDQRQEPFAVTVGLRYDKRSVANFTAGLAQLVAEKGICVNCVAPGPIWTPLVASTMPEAAIKSFGGNTSLERAGQPAELAPAHVLLASDEASYMTGAIIPVTGGRPML